MREIMAQLLELVWGVWRFRWIALLAIWLVALAGWVGVSLMPERYLASARIYVDTNSILRPLLRGLTVQPDVDQRIALLSRTLLSRPNLEKLMHMAELDLQASNAAEKEKLLNQLRRSISLSGQKRDTSLYSVSYKHEDPATAKKMVESLITVFVESALGDKRKDSSGAQDFLDKQIADYEQRLVEAEDRLAKFKQRNVGVLPGEHGGYYQHLEEEKAQLSVALLQLKEVENRRQELQRLVDGEEPVFLTSQFDSSPQIMALEQRIATLQERLDSLLLRYTARHPDVTEIGKMLASLKAKKRAEVARLQQAMPQQYANLQDNPVYQQMRTMLAEAEASAAALRTRVDAYRQRVEELEKKVDNIPLIESQLQQLNRDYDVIAQQHKTLLSRREAARLSENVEQQASDVKFRVIDPPFVPQKPSEPNKLLLNTLVLALALAVGVGIALLLSLLRPVISNRDTLAQVSGMPVLGTVLIIRSPVEKRRIFINTLVFAGLSIMLLLIFVGLSAYQVMDIEGLAFQGMTVRELAGQPVNLLAGAVRV